MNIRITQGMAMIIGLSMAYTAAWAKPYANDDLASVTSSAGSTVTGNVINNDVDCDTATLGSPPASQYGYLSLQSNGGFSYSVYDSTPALLALKAGESVTQSFLYACSDVYGKSAYAVLTVQIIGNPSNSGNPIVPTELPPPLAHNDSVTVVPDLSIAGNSTVSGDVLRNDANCTDATLQSSPVSPYGYLNWQGTDGILPQGYFSFTVYDNAPAILALKVGDIVTQTFDYSCTDDYGRSSNAQLTVQIIGNPVDNYGNVIFPNYDNVDIEFNNRSKQATPLTSTRTIKGHMYMATDKDWFILHSAGDEVIKLELCPQGSTCFNKKSWIVYVFDRDLLTQQIEEQSYAFRRWVDETGSTADLLGNQILPSAYTGGSSNHMYLAYRLGVFGNPDTNIDGPLLGIIDSCFGTRTDDSTFETSGSNNTVEFGVPPGEKDYLIAVSTPLHGDKDEGQNDCGQGSVVLEKPGLSARGLRPVTTTVDGVSTTTAVSGTYGTTDEYISILHSDDQYAIRVTSTGQNPLLSEQAIIQSPTFSTASANANSAGKLVLPKVKVGDAYYQAILSHLPPDSNYPDSYAFEIVALEPLTDATATVDAFQATYNPITHEVVIPRVTVNETGNGYSVILKYHSHQRLELVKATLIK